MGPQKLRWPRAPRSLNPSLMITQEFLLFGGVWASPCVPQLRPCLWLILCCSGGHQTAPNVIKPKVVKETLQWRPERLAQVQSYVNQTELQVNWTYNAISSLLFNGKSRRTINYPLYDAIHENNRLHIRAIHASAQNSPKLNFIIIHDICTWNVDRSFLNRNVQ